MLKLLALYTVSATLIALNAVVCLSYGFGIHIQHWGGVFAYTVGYVAVTATYNLVAWHLKTFESGQWKTLPVEFVLTVRGGTPVSVVAAGTVTE